MPRTAAPLLAQRALIIAAAGVVVVLAAVWLRGTHAETQLARYAYAPKLGMVRAAAPGVPGLVERADRLNGDTKARVSQAIIEYRLGHGARASRILRGIVAGQPAAVDAWGILAVIEDRYAPDAAARVRAQIRRLNPLAGQARR